MRLKGKTALVTGAAKRVGREIALGLARHGANIVVHYNTSAADARRAVAEIKALGVDAITVKADQANARQVHAAVTQALKHFGTIDVLITSAAVYKKTPFDTLTERDWDFHINANLKGPFLFALGSRTTHESAAQTARARSFCLPIGRRFVRTLIICRTASRKRASSV